MCVTRFGTALPHPHGVARFCLGQEVCAERHNPPELVLLLSTTEPPNGIPGGIPLHHLCRNRRKTLTREKERYEKKEVLEQ